MASIGDYIFLAIVLAVVGGIVYAIRGSSVNESFTKQQEAMKAKGFSLSSDGIAIKGSGRKLTRQEEVDNAHASIRKSNELMAKHKKAFGFRTGEAQ